MVKMKNTGTMLKARPELFEEWDFARNNELGLDIYKVAQYSRVTAWWRCPKCEISYQNAISNRAGGYGCPYCSGRRVKPEDSIAYTHPEIMKEWNKDLNKKTNPLELSFGSDKVVWWTCLKCESNYKKKVDDRVNKNRGCPYCKKSKLNHTKSLAVLNPELAKQWHPTKNGDLTPDDVMTTNRMKVWWIDKCGHEWKTATVNRSYGSGCPYCCFPPVKILKGFNDMWTINPELAKQLLNPEDGYIFMQYTNTKLDWKCRGCSNIIQKLAPLDYSKKQGYCRNCSDGCSYGEKVMISFLSHLNLSFDYDKKKNWSNNKRYDFYLPDFNTIIETHGGQHYNEHGFGLLGGRSLIEEQVNDRYKHVMAMHNRVENYIVIDVSRDDWDFIKNNIISSRMLDVLEIEELDWNEVKIDSLKSIVIKSAELWNSGITSAPKIGEILKISRATARNYLKKASSAGLCDYNATKVREETIKNLNKRRNEKRGYIRT